MLRGTKLCFASAYHLNSLRKDSFLLLATGSDLLVTTDVSLHVKSHSTLQPSTTRQAEQIISDTRKPEALNRVLVEEPYVVTLKADFHPCSP